MSLKNKIDVNLECTYWVNFKKYVLKKYPPEHNNKFFKYYVDMELAPYHAKWLTNYMSFSQLKFENEKYKTMFLLKWS